MASLTVENYVKAIFQVSLSGEGQAATGQLATALGVSPGTVTSMLKTLSESGLVTYTPYEGVRLVAFGHRSGAARRRRHRLIELFLVKTLDLNWDEVHEEAEHMEHAVSDRLIDKIDAFLGHPRVDPHGDPIPRSDGTFDMPQCRPLAECAVGEEFRLSRVIDQSPEFLRFLSGSGLPLGVQGRIIANREEAGIVTVDVGGHETTLGRAAAEKILVTSANGK